MTFDDIRPFIRGASLFNWTWDNADFTVAYDCRIFAIHSGEARLCCEDGIYHMKQGGTAFFNAAQPYRFRMCEPGLPFSLLCINLDLTCSRTDVERFVQPSLQYQFNPAYIIDRIELPELVHPIIITDDCGLCDKVSEIFSEYHGSSPHSQLRMSLLATDYLISALRLSEGGSPRSAKLIESIKGYIHTHYSNKVTNEIIADELGYHPYYIARLFKSRTGVSLHRYLLEYRLQTAYQLLTICDRPIEDIAAECGFSSAAHLATAFKRKYQRSPSELRMM